ncbi:hypothetical protein [Pseudomonas lini]|uniref:Glycosyltransferase RgtA/B/C/D-like domain-containing protein n=1 Tax=Pseudomonas lini TaxID=163011 RepID=A0A0J6H6N4_9PSED|nr:hypothetical protein [Pseudomonas lini]KAB0508742.1 hypothetical protein F7R14_03625 [Pseudomonas lini]KMM92636.1 hypothetical protein TU81_15390 [Pseudomonas lini]SDS95395.1 hypothetical protein SAMN04490191_2755 [Pseudomonas lini]
MEVLAKLESKPNIYSFCIVFLTLLITHQILGIKEFPFDSSTYWTLSTPASVANFPDIVRGYVYAYLLFPIHALTDAINDSGRIVFRVSTSAIYAYLLTGPVANFFLQCFGGRLTVSRRILFALLTIGVFPGLFLYPLSDMPAVLTLIIAIAFAERAKGKYWLAFLFFSGAAVSAAYNIRTIYIFSFIALLFIIPFVFLRSKSWSARRLGIIAFILGAFIVALPQMAINKRIHDVATPLVFATVQGKSLMATQLYWGVTIQRYETYNGGDTPAPSLYYKDSAGITLRSLYESQFTNDPTIAGYISLVAKHPVQFIGIYGRHFINGIDVRDGLVYATKPSINKSIVAFLCFSLFFFGALIFCTRKTPRWIEMAYLAPLLIPVLAIIPGAVETRFFMPLYLVLFGSVVTQFEWQEFSKLLKRHCLPILASYALLAASFLAVTTAAMACVSYTLP